MNVLRSIWPSATPAPSNPALLRSQVKAFRHQIPMMYFIVCVNTVALAWTHFATAPHSLTLAAPAALIIISLVRLGIWWNLRSETVTDVVAERTLRSTLVFAAVLGVGFTTWALLLLPYGDAYTQMHIVFSMAVTLIVASFCLTHLKLAAFMLIGIATIPFVLVFGRYDNAVLRAVSVNLLLVAAGLVLILDRLYRDFVTLIDSRRALQDKQAELERLNAEVSRLANTDSLTGLPNRRSFFAEIEERLDDARRRGMRLAVGVVDLDGFKPVNDSFGHLAGDRVLVEVAARLRTLAAAGFSTARLGGDEFGILLGGALGDDDLRRAGQTLCDLLSQPYDACAAAAGITASVGFARFPDAGLSGEELFECADYALYHAKHHARGGTVVFDETHEPNIRQLRIMLQARRQFLETRQGMVA